MKKKVDALVVVRSLQQKANPLGKKVTDLEISNQKEFDLAGKLLKQIKDMKKIAVERKEEMIDPLRHTIGLISNHFKPFEEWVDQIDQDVKLKMSVYLEDLKRQEAKLVGDYDTGKIKRASTYVGKAAQLKQQAISDYVQTREVNVINVDVTKLPAKYLVPNMKAIKADLKAGKTIKGVTITKKQSIAV